MRENPKRGELWVHTKTGNLYNILFIGRLEWTSEEAVIYRRLDHKEHPDVWVRPMKSFMHHDLDAMFPRFQRSECDR